MDTCYVQVIKTQGTGDVWNSKLYSSSVSLSIYLSICYVQVIKTQGTGDVWNSKLYSCSVSLSIYLSIQEDVVSQEQETLTVMELNMTPSVTQRRCGGLGVNRMAAMLWTLRKIFFVLFLFFGGVNQVFNKLVFNLTTPTPTKKY